MVVVVNLLVSLNTRATLTQIWRWCIKKANLFLKARLYDWVGSGEFTRLAKTSWATSLNEALQCNQPAL